MNQKTKRFFFPLFLLCVLAIIFIAPVKGATTAGGGCVEGGEGLQNPLTACSFEELVKDIATWFYYIMIPISAIMVLYAGALFMTSAGNEERIAKAKRALLWAIVGVAIILINYGFIDLIKSFLETNK
ncbi:MAG: pilin [bacterium]